MRLLLRMEEDGSFDLETAIGAEGVVYPSIPKARSGQGKVHLTPEGRLVECPAISDTALPTGTQVMVIGVLGGEIVEVVPSPVLGGILDVVR
jgi:hypothetical protein